MEVKTIARDNFKAGIKRKLAERAGYICSFPGCNKLTIGPSKIFNFSILTGKASHIEAASPNGPRYNKNQKKGERISIENGIWLCSTHADLIDKDYKRYSVADLKEIKRLHEENIYYKQCGILPEAGNIIGISISNYGPIGNTINIDLQKNNIIWGTNGIGKTFIFDNLSSLVFKEKIKKWRHYKRDFSSIFNIIFLKERKHEIKIEISKSNDLNYYYDNLIFSNIIPPYNVVYLADDFIINYFDLNNLLKEVNDDQEYEIKYNKYYLDVLLKYLNINIDVFKTLVKYISINEKLFIYGIEFENAVLKAQIKHDSYLLKFSQLSGSEMERVILELGFQLSKLYSEISPTLFLIEHAAFSIFDDELVVQLLKLIIEKNYNFQTIITFPDLFLLKKYANAYDNYHLIHLVFEDENVKLDT